MAEQELPLEIAWCQQIERSLPSSIRVLQNSPGLWSTYPTLSFPTLVKPVGSNVALVARIRIDCCYQRNRLIRNPCSNCHVQSMRRGLRFRRRYWLNVQSSANSIGTNAKSSGMSVPVFKCNRSRMFCQLPARWDTDAESGENLAMRGASFPACLRVWRYLPFQTS